MTDAILQRPPVKGADASIDLIEIDGIFYLQAQGDDTLIRIKRNRLTTQSAASPTFPVIM
ncbi:MAG: hypothetical protein OET63_06345 [Desulfobacterales bacterium]|nr:hypothetical protein [Desulfobacterales bacterium]